MIKWKPFVYQDTTYDLSHLHPFDMIVAQKTKLKKPSRDYNISVFFSLHCFTYSLKSTRLTHRSVSPSLYYRDSREARIFCFTRYELSKNLPCVIRNIGESNCFHGVRDNYFVIKLLSKGSHEFDEYEVFFRLYKSKKKKSFLELYVQSAYIRDKDHRQNKPKTRKPIKFQILAYNTFNGKKIKVPK